MNRRWLRPLATVGLTLLTYTVATASAADLPDLYFKLLQDGITRVEEHLAQEPEADLRTLEKQRRWRHFPHAILIAAVLYSQQHPSNLRYQDSEMLSLARRIGDLTARESESGSFQQRLDHHRDLYMWLEAYRLLKDHLEPRKKEFWRRELQRNAEGLAIDIAARADFAAYIAPFIGTSPNHYSLWASTLYLAAKVLGNSGWGKLSAQVLHRFAKQEQAPGGYWGEHDSTGPTTGYDYLTFTGVALYWEHSKDPEAKKALRRGTTFHEYFTYSDGNPVEVINDRNRYWSESTWGHFGFSHFPDGRRYAQFLTSLLDREELGLEELGRIAQNTLYFHPGPIQPIPQDEKDYAYRMDVPASVRKTGPWVICLSGLISSQAPTNQYFLDRQGNLSVYHEKTGLMITGANSKRQYELATFWERLGSERYHLPMSSRLGMGDDRDRLSLAFHSFFVDLYVPIPVADDASFHFVVTPKRQRDEACLNLQLCLSPGKMLDTESGEAFLLGTEQIRLGPAQLGGWLRHQGWTLWLDSEARLSWPVYPFNPYANAPEKSVDRAVGLLSIPLNCQRLPGKPYGSGAQEINIRLRVD